MTQEIDLDAPDYEGIEKDDTVRFEVDAIFGPHQATMYHDGPYEGSVAIPDPDGAGDITVCCGDTSRRTVDVDVYRVEVIDRGE